jgi:glycosyltransferase involved in cell wall biosynthesis
MEVMAGTIYKYEIIFVNYGDNELSWNAICQLSDNFSFIRGVNLESNYSQAKALRTGFSFAKGDVIMVMDGDMCHDPAYMPVFLAYIERGYEVVCGLRKQDQPENLLQSLLTTMTQRMIFSFAGVNVKYLGATNQAYRRYLLGNLDRIGDTRKFLNTLVKKKVARAIDVPIKFRTRNAALVG